jgi:hypothetical protein
MMKDLRGSSHGLIKVLAQHLSSERITKKNTYDSVSAKIRTGYLLSNSLDCDYSTNQLNNDDATSFLIL